MIHVPYKGSGPALMDLIADHVPLMAANVLVWRAPGERCHDAQTIRG